MSHERRLCSGRLWLAAYAGLVESAATIRSGGSAASSAATTSRKSATLGGHSMRPRASATRASALATRSSPAGGMRRASSVSVATASPSRPI
jgi:hypothetical protein